MPRGITAYDCAKAGYINIGMNKIKCAHCGHTVHLKSQIESALSEEFLKNYRIGYFMGISQIVCFIGPGMNLTMHQNVSFYTY